MVVMAAEFRLKGGLMGRWETQLRKGVVDLAVMAAIGEGESYGYGIVERLKGHAGLELTESTIYPVLARLEHEGFLAIRSGDSPLGPRRRYYRLTAAGRERFQGMAEGFQVLSRSLSRLIEGVK